MNEVIKGSAAAWQRKPADQIIRDAAGGDLSSLIQEMKVNREVPQTYKFEDGSSGNFFKLVEKAVEKSQEDGAKAPIETIMIESMLDKQEKS